MTFGRVATPKIQTQTLWYVGTSYLNNGLEVPTKIPITKVVDTLTAHTQNTLPTIHFIFLNFIILWHGSRSTDTSKRACIPVPARRHIAWTTRD